jgi:hypothetical protein
MKPLKAHRNKCSEMFGDRGRNIGLGRLYHRRLYIPSLTELESKKITRVKQETLDK